MEKNLLTTAELAAEWCVDESVVRQLFRRVPGVLQFWGRNKRGRGASNAVILRIPRAVADRIYEERATIGPRNNGGTPTVPEAAFEAIRQLEARVAILEGLVDALALRRAETLFPERQRSSAPSANKKVLLNEREVQAIYGIGTSHLRRMRMRNAGPRHTKISGRVGETGGRVLYKVTDLEEWLSKAPGGGTP